MKITDYQKVTTLDDDNIFLLDGLTGTKTIEAKDLAKEIHRRSKFYDMLDFYEVPVGVRRKTFRGKSLGASFTDVQMDEIVAGTFKGLFLGDFWTIDNRVFRIVDFDYWIKTGSPLTTAHHIAVMPDDSFYNAKMNDTATVLDGYVGSKMYTENLETAKTLISSAFGAGNLLSHREYFVNSTSDGIPSSGGWYNSVVDLPNEIEMYGSYIMAFAYPTSNITTIARRYTVDKTQLALMEVVPSFITGLGNNWLRDIAYTSAFACVSANGLADSRAASDNAGVRPLFAIGSAS